MKLNLLGCLAKDRISGFEGVVVAHCRYWHNSDSAALRSRTLKDGLPLATQWFDVSNIDVLKQDVVFVIPAPENPFIFGQVVKDSLSGLKGPVIGYTRWISGCIRIGIQSSALKDGEPVDAAWLPSTQVIGTSKMMKTEKQEQISRPGGPMKDPTYVKNPR